MAAKCLLISNRQIMFGFVGAIIFAQSNSFAGRPLVVDDAAPVAPSHFELELAFAQGRSYGGGREQHLPGGNFAYGVLDGLEIGAGIRRVNKNAKGSSPTEGFEDLHLHTKYRFLAEDDLSPAVALSFDLRLPTANRRKGFSPGKTDETFLIIATKTWTPLTFHLNSGYSIVGHSIENKLKNRIRGGAAVEWQVHPDWTLVGEISAISREFRGAPNIAEFQAGLKYLLTPAVVLDSAIGRSLRSSGAAIQGTIGLTWTINTSSLFTK
jgi:hypothetical protein